MPIISIASSTLAFSHSLIDALNFAIHNNFQGFEIDADPPRAYPDDLSLKILKKIKTIIVRNKIKLSVHCPISSVNISSINSGIRKESIRQMKKCIDILNFLENEILVIHSGISDFDIDEIKTLSFNINLDSLKECAEYASSRGIILALENTGINKLDNIQNFITLKKILNKIKSLKITYDIGHAFVKKEFKSFLTMFRDDIVHIHISDNNGKFDEHKAIGDGKINYAPVIQFLKDFNNMIVLEIFYWKSPIKALLKSKREFEKMLK